MFSFLSSQITSGYRKIIREKQGRRNSFGEKAAGCLRLLFGQGKMIDGMIHLCYHKHTKRMYRCRRRSDGKK
ncbi:hypothetical protein B5E82_03915 [Lachnoclostridium sp. An138]|nr:hypothetical protein B5E82_03915 [Lachnoclostridium sp. An138]